MSQYFSKNGREVIFIRDAITGVAFPVLGDISDGSVKVSGTVTTTLPKSSTPTISRVATSTSSAQVLASNTSRKKAIVINDSAANLYLKFGTTASATDYSVLLQPNDGWEETTYTGRIDAILASGTGNAQVTEM